MYMVILVQTHKECRFTGVGIYGRNCKVATKGNKMKVSLQIKLV